MPIKPLNRIHGLNTMPEAVLNKKPSNSSTVANLTPHSSHTHSKSEHYHAHIIEGHGRQSSARITDQLNPDRSVSMANKTGRSFPGLAN